MLCERCKKNEAVVFYKEIVNGQKRSFSLCEKCAKEAESTGVMPKLGESFWNEPATDAGSIFGSLFGLPQYHKRAASEIKKCTLCGATFADLVSEGKAGCPECYRVFSEELSPTVTRIHGAAVHTGGAPERHRAGRERKAQIASLEAELKAAIASEEYEKAACLRDKLKELRDESSEA